MEKKNLHLETTAGKKHTKSCVREALPKIAKEQTAEAVGINASPSMPECREIYQESHVNFRCVSVCPPACFSIPSPPHTHLISIFCFLDHIWGEKVVNENKVNPVSIFSACLTFRMGYRGPALCF